VPATIILVGVAENVGELITDHGSIRRALTPVKLERMMDHELEEILQTRLKLTPFNLEQNARRKIIRLSHGLPYYIHMLGKYSFKTAAIRRELAISSQTVDFAIDEFVEDTEQFYYDDYYTAVSSNQTDSLFREVLLACAQAKSNESGFFSATSIIAGAFADGHFARPCDLSHLILPSPAIHSSIAALSLKPVTYRISAPGQ
jgi:hypothetical protein